MTDDTLATASNYTLYVALALLALAMIGFALHLAVQGATATRAAGARRREPVAVPAGVSAGSTVRPEGVDVAEPTPADPDPMPPGPAGAEPPASRRWGVLALQTTWLATFALVASVALRGLSVGRPPVGNMFEFAVAAAAFTLVIYAGWSLRSERLWLGLFVTAPVLLILGAAVVSWYTPAGQLLPSLNSKVWLVVHVTVATLTIGIFTIGFVLALLYLLRERAEERGRPSWRWLAALPRPRQLEQMTYGLHIVAFPLWTFTVIAGAIWAEQAWGRYWGWDPKEVWSFVIWTAYAAYLHARATTGWTTRRATWLAVAGFTCIILNYTVVNTFFVGLHSYSGL
jgi:cytochrome c-type biogenesis protein CcsB